MSVIYSCMHVFVYKSWGDEEDVALPLAKHGVLGVKATGAIIST